MFLLFERKLMGIGFYESGKFLVYAKKIMLHLFICFSGYWTLHIVYIF